MPPAHVCTLAAVRSVMHSHTCTLVLTQTPGRACSATCTHGHTTKGQVHTHMSSHICSHSQRGAFSRVRPHMYVHKEARACSHPCLLRHAHTPVQTPGCLRSSTRTHVCTLTPLPTPVPAEARLSTSLGMKSLSSELRAQSFMPRRPFMGKLMSLDTAETGSRWMLITAGTAGVIPRTPHPRTPHPRTPTHPTPLPVAHPGCR